MARHAAQQEKASQAADKEQVVIDQVLAMRDAGELAYRIAEKMGLTKTFVRKVLKQFPKKD